MTSDDLRAVADHINTGLACPDTSRALVVFNLTEQFLGGAAVFLASMSWPRDTPLPPVVVTDLTGVPVAATIQYKAEAPDTKGRADRRLLSFALCFQVSDVPPNGWHTYMAAYADVPSPPLQDFVETTGLVVVETSRHGGDLPPVGNF